MPCHDHAISHSGADEEEVGKPFHNPFHRGLCSRHRPPDKRSEQMPPSSALDQVRRLLAAPMERRCHEHNRWLTLSSASSFAIDHADFRAMSPVSIIPHTSKAVSFLARPFTHNERNRDGRRRKGPGHLVHLSSTALALSVRARKGSFTYPQLLTTECINNLVGYLMIRELRWRRLQGGPGNAFC